VPGGQQSDGEIRYHHTTILDDDDDDHRPVSSSPSSLSPPTPAAGKRCTSGRRSTRRPSEEEGTTTEVAVHRKKTDVLTLTMPTTCSAKKGGREEVADSQSASVRAKPATSKLVSTGKYSTLPVTSRSTSASTLLTFVAWDALTRTVPRTCFPGETRPRRPSPLPPIYTRWIDPRHLDGRAPASGDALQHLSAASPRPAPIQQAVRHDGAHRPHSLLLNLKRISIVRASYCKNHSELTLSAG
jgi:hypothetical protein